MRWKQLMPIVAAAMLLSQVMPTTLTHATSNQGESHGAGRQRPNALQGDVKAHAEKEITSHRKRIIEEAESALVDTKKALRALEAKKTEEALAALARVSGKLNIVLAREPKLALAPIDVTVTIYDVDTTMDAIKATRKAAETYVANGEVQKARMLLRGFASEMVITELSLPLQTYPNAIAAVVPLIDQGKIDEAKAAIGAALNTLVATEHIVPLPVVRAEAHLAKAETLVQKEGRSEDDNKTLAKLLDDTRQQLTLAEALGYGHKRDYKAFYAELEEIEDKTKGGKSATGLFAKVKEHLSDLRRSVFD